MISFSVKKQNADDFDHNGHRHSMAAQEVSGDDVTSTRILSWKLVRYWHSIQRDDHDASKRNDVALIAHTTSDPDHLDHCFLSSPSSADLFGISCFS